MRVHAAASVTSNVTCSALPPASTIADDDVAGARCIVHRMHDHVHARAAQRAADRRADRAAAAGDQCTLHANIFHVDIMHGCTTVQYGPCRGGRSRRRYAKTSPDAPSSRHSIRSASSTSSRNARCSTISRTLPSRPLVSARGGVCRSAPCSAIACAANSMPASAGSRPLRAQRIVQLRDAGSSCTPVAAGRNAGSLPASPWRPRAATGSPAGGNGGDRHRRKSYGERRPGRHLQRNTLGCPARDGDEQRQRGGDRRAAPVARPRRRCGIRSPPPRVRRRVRASPATAAPACVGDGTAKARRRTTAGSRWRPASACG